MAKINIREIAFDFDGVLIDSNGSSVKEIQTVGQSLTGKLCSVESLLAHWGIIFEELLEAVYPEITFEEYVKESDRLGFGEKMHPRIPGARLTIELLSKHYSLSIVTNRERTSLNKILERLEIDQSKFKLIQSCSETKFHKPDGRVFNQLFNVSGVTSEEVLYVGDLLIDRQTALSAGTHFAGVLSGGMITRQNFLEVGVPKDLIFQSICDIPDYLGLL